MKKIICFLSAMCLLLLSCASEKEEEIQKEEESKPLLEGLFSGIFSVTYFVDMGSWKDGSGAAIIKFENGRFYSTGNPDGSKIPNGGSGAFSVNGDTITFNDENGWLANFDLNLVLKGEWNFEYDGKNLRIWRCIYEIAFYEYVLERQ